MEKCESDPRRQLFKSYDEVRKGQLREELAKGSNFALEPVLQKLLEVKETMVSEQNFSQARAVRLAIDIIKAQAEEIDRLRANNEGS